MRNDHHIFSYFSYSNTHQIQNLEIKQKKKLIKGAPLELDWKIWILGSDGNDEY